MEQITLNLPATDVLRWAREDARRTVPTLAVRAAKEYTAETDLDLGRYDPGDEDSVSRVSIHGVLELSPRRGRGGWKLEVRADDAIGLEPDTDEDDHVDDDDMAVDAFEEQFLAPHKAEIEVVVEVADGPARTRFRRWLARMTKPSAPSGRR